MIALKKVLSLLLVLASLLTLASCAKKQGSATEVTGTEATKPTENDGCKHEYERTGLMSSVCKKCGEKEENFAPKSVKILAIGNSFSDDATNHLWNIFKNAGVENVVIGNMFIGGCSLDTHYNNAISGSTAYIYRKNTSGEWINTENTSLATAIADEDWDVVTLQQSSGVSGQKKSYGVLKALVNYVKNKLPTAELYWHMTWAYQQSSNHSDFPKYDRNQTKMYNAICEAVKSAVLPIEDFVGVIPSGTSIQNLRSSYFGDTLTRDGFHLTYDYGRYLTALTYFAALGGDVENIDWVPVLSMKYDLPAIKEATKTAIEKNFEVTKSTHTVRPTKKEGFVGVEKVLEMNGKDIKNYTEIDIGEIFGAFYNATEASNPSGLNTGTSFTQQFTTTKIFTREDLPVGSIIIIEDGYKYRPEAWTKFDTVLPVARPELTSNTFTLVTETWWDIFEYRAFNVSKTVNATLSKSDMGKLHILVPKA